MAKRSRICILRFTGKSSGFFIQPAVSPKWNQDNRAYEALASAFAPSLKISCKDYIIEKEKPSEQTLELRQALKDYLLGDSACAVRVVDLTKCRLGLNVLDTLTDNFGETAIQAERAAVLLLPASAIPVIMGSPRFAELGEKLKEKQGVLFLVDQVGSVFQLGERHGITLPSVIHSLQEQGGAPTAEEFRKRAVRQSNRWFGHFIMSSGAHVRTIYDCYYGVLLDDWLFRFIAPAALKVIERLKPDMIVGFGLTEMSVMQFVTQLQKDGNPPRVMKTSDSKEYLEKIPLGSKVLLVSDVVLTGATAEKILDEVQNSGSEVVGLLTLLALKNSVNHIADEIPVSAICTVNRTFYENEDDCPLCRCEYPKQKVHQYLDFHSLPKLIHPYDFWEAVNETRAFSHIHQEIKGRHYSYYINIESLCQLYAEPIARQLVHQLKLVTNTASVKFVIYPESPAARMLAEAVARHLPISKEKVLSIDRDFLVSLPSIVNFRLPQALEQIRNEPVIIVDDGCNTLETISRMENVLRRAHATGVGYLVALNRANQELTELKVKQSRRTFQYYYHWPIGVSRSAQDCPDCAFASPSA